MDERLEECRQGGVQAARFTMNVQQPDGGYIWGDTRRFGLDQAEQAAQLAASEQCGR